MKTADDADTATLVQVMSRRAARVYDPEARRTHEALPVTAQLGEQTARMEVEGMPSSDWLVDTQQWACPCRY